MRSRPAYPRINRRSPLAQGLVCALVGGGAGRLVAFDASGYGRHCTLTNMAVTAWAWEPTLDRWAIDYGGAGSGDQIVPATAISLGASPWTFACWANIDALTGYFFGETAATSRCSIGGTGGVGIRNDSNANVNIGAAGSVVTGIAHYAIVRDSANFSLYRNGVLVGGPTAVWSPPGTVTISRFGCGRITSTENALDGRMTDILVYDRALPQTAIAKLADPADTLLGGLVDQPRRVFPAAGNARRRRLLTGAAA